MALWRSGDGGSSWERTPLPATSGSSTQCEIAIAADDPRVMALAVTHGDSGWQPGSGNALLLSRDGGATWAPITRVPSTTAAQAGGGGTQTAVAVAAKALYLWSSYGGAAGTPQTSGLVRTQDGGATWTRVDGAFGPGALFFPPAVGPGGALAVSVYREGAGATPARLWLSADAGDSWRDSGALPDDAGTMLLAPPTTTGEWPGAGRPFYDLVSEQIPSSLYRERVVQTEDGQHWTLLPPLPVPGTNAEQYGIFQALAVAPDGRLLVFGADPRAGVPAEGSDEATSAPQAFWLWMWNPRAGRWSVLSRPLAFPGRVVGALGWQARAASGADGATYLYAADWFDGGNETLWRVRLLSLSNATS